MPTLNDFITEIITGEYGLDIVNYGKDSNGDFQPFEVDVNGKQYVINEATATKLDTLIAKDFATETKLEAVRALLELVEGKDFATETTLDNRLSSLETKIDTLLNSQDVDDNIKVSQNGSILAKDPTTGDYKELTATQDENGEYVLKIVDSAPWAYDETTQTFSVRTSLARTNLSEYTLTTEDVPAGGNSSTLIVDLIQEFGCLPETYGFELTCDGGTPKLGLYSMLSSTQAESSSDNIQYTDLSSNASYPTVKEIDLNSPKIRFILSETGGSTDLTNVTLKLWAYTAG